VDVRFVEIEPGVRIVQAVDFVGDDPAFAGTMTMTWTITAIDEGSRVDIVADHVPAGISAKDHANGLASSLENLANHVENHPEPASSGERMPLHVRAARTVRLTLVDRAPVRSCWRA
jgi:hypothetical protein